MRSIQTHQNYIFEVNQKRDLTSFKHFTAPKIKTSGTNAGTPYTWHSYQEFNGSKFVDPKATISEFYCILCIDWLETEVDNNWSVHDKAFLSDVTSLGFHAIYDTLTEAQKKCVELSSSDCRGVTFTGWPSKGWQLRRGNIPKQSPDCEISFIRPST